MSYTLLANGCIRRDEDDAIIPADTANRDYAVFIQWLTDGGIPSQEQVQRKLTTSDNTFGDDPWQF